MCWQALQAPWYDQPQFISSCPSDGAINSSHSSYACQWRPANPVVTLSRRGHNALHPRYPLNCLESRHPRLYTGSSHLTLSMARICSCQCQATAWHGRGRSRHSLTNLRAPPTLHGALVYPSTMKKYVLDASRMRTAAGTSLFMQPEPADPDGQQQRAA